MSTKPWLAGWVGRVESRPLSLFRIALGALLLKNALYLIPVAHLFYSDEGLVPRAQFWAAPAQVGLGQFSLLNRVGTSWGAVLFFGAWAMVALALLVGYRTRLMTVLNYAIWLSVLHRNPFSLHAPDHVLLLLSFWVLFLPLDHHYTLQHWFAWRRQQGASDHATLCYTNREPAQTTYAFPVRIIQLQIALIYCFTSYTKWQGLYWRTGEALFYTFQQQSFLSPVGLWLSATAPLWLYHLLTWATLLIEAGFPLLVFLPVGQPWAKAVGLTLAASLHLGIAITMAIPDFSLVMVSSYLLFFEPEWVRWLERQGWRRLRLPPTALPGQPVTPVPPRWPQVISQGMLTGILLLLLTAAMWGGFTRIAATTGKVSRAEPPLLAAINQQLHLASPWSMFAYRQRPRSGWLVIEGEFAAGGRQLLYTGIDQRSGQPTWVWGPGARLRFFEQRLLWAFPEPLLHAWGAYYCRLYNRAPTPSTAGQLIQVDIHRRYHWTHAPSEPPAPDEDDHLWRYSCLTK